MKTIMSQIKSKEELEEILEEVDVFDQYNWFGDAQIDVTSKKGNPVNRDCEVCADRKGRKGCDAKDCLYTLDFSKIAINMYGYIVGNTFGKIRNRSLNKRICKLVKNFNGMMFYNYEHQLRFKRVVKMVTRINPRTTKKTISALFFLTVTDNLWQKVKPNVGDFEIDFRKMTINDITVNEYALLMIAKTVYSSNKMVMTSKSFEIDELIDEDIITDDIFKMYINGQLVKRHGLDVLTLDYAKNKKSRKENCLYENNNHKLKTR